MNGASAWWDALFAQGRDNPYSAVEPPAPDDPVCRAAAEWFGDVAGKTVLDVGCGRGASSLFFASLGARVVSVDASPVAIKNLAQYCRANGIDNVLPLCVPAQRIADLREQVDARGAALGPVDFIFGSMILHHVEPFVEFAAALRATLRDGGRAFFFENNARSQTLVWFRDHVVGRWWVPKLGDPEESPLSPEEIDELRRHFAVEITYPWLRYFSLISTYLLRGRCETTFTRLDRWAYDRWPALRPHSYVQYLRLS